MADRIDQLKIGNTSYDIALPADSKDTMFYTTASSTANAFTVTIPDLVSLYDGAIINVKFNAATAANCTLNVNSLGAKRIEYRVGTWCTTHISANMYITLVYNASGNSNAGTWVMQGAYYSDSNTATAADNILDGSNSGTQITYAPYTSQQSKLSFDISTTNPARTDRLNLNGHLHTTRLSLSDAAPVVFSIVPNGNSSVNGIYNCSLPVSVFNALYNYIGNGKTVVQDYYDGGGMYTFRSVKTVHTATWTTATSPAGSTYQSIACCATVPYFYLVKLSDSQIGVYSYASSTPLKVFMTGTDSTLYGYLINRTIDTTEVTNIDNINSIINLVKGVDNLVKSVDSTVVHKGTSSSPSYETIYGTKYFAFEPGGAAAYTHKISLQPYESAGANKIVHTNNNGTTAYKLTLPDKNGTLATTDDVAAVDDVIEGYYSNGKFYSDSAKTKEITGEGGKIYTDLTSNKTYRWGGTEWVEISASVPTASSTTLGGIKIGHVNDGLVPVQYPVELDSENEAYVSVPIYEYHGTTYGDCYAIDSPNDDYSMQIGSSGFTVDVGDTVNPDSNLLQVSSDKFQYRQSDVMTGETEHLQSKNFKHWYGTFVCPSNTYYYRLLAKAANSGSDAGLCQTITIRGTIGGWGGSEQCEFMYTVALRSSSFSTANNIRKTIFRGSTYTTESAIASNAGIDIVTHRDSSSGALYVYLRAYGTQKYSQYNIIVTANGCSSYSAGINGQVDVVELPTDENFYPSSSGTLVSGSQLLSSTQNQCIEITNKNLRTINGYSLMGDTNLILQDERIKDHTSTDTSGYIFSTYCVIGNMQICWGHVNSSSGSTSVTVNVNFPLSFSGNPVVFVQSYNVTGIPTSEKENVTSQTQYRNAQSIRQVTSTSFKFDTGNAEAHGYSWIAIGRYKGSGA